MAAAATGFYGKLPCRGDFMQRRVPQDFVDVWDAWLQESLQASRQELGEAWLNIYLTSPVWRFVLAENICGGHGYAGVMLPSVDRVGRYFPLTLVSPLDVGSCALEVACGVGRPWFDAAESLALAALDASELDLESFDASVEALQGLAAHVDLARSGELMELMASADFARDGSLWHVSMLGDTPQRAVNAFASIALQRTFRPCALWWTQGSDAMSGGWLVTRGLPPPASFTALLSGQWHRGGWKSIDVAPNTGAAFEPQPGSAQTDELGNGARQARERDLATERPPVMDIDAPLSAVPEIAAVHPQPMRALGDEVEPRFVTRPEIGLWGVAWAGSATASASRADADLVADLAYNASPQADLTALVEETRRSLQRVIEPRGGVTRPSGGAVGLVFFLVQGAECALVWSGAMRAFRIRGGTAIPLIDEVPDPPGTALGPEAEPDAATVNAGGDSLLALVTPSAQATPAAVPAIGVRYERLRAGDLWVLGAASALDDADLDRVTAATRNQANGGEGTPGDRALESLLAECVPGPGTHRSAPPLMLLAARIPALSEP